MQAIVYPTGDREVKPFDKRIVCSNIDPSTEEMGGLPEEHKTAASEEHVPSGMTPPSMCREDDEPLMDALIAMSKGAYSTE